MADHRAADAEALHRVVAGITRQHALIAGRHRREHAAAHPQAIEQHLHAVGRNAARLRQREVAEMQPRVEVGEERRDAGRLAAKLVVVPGPVSTFCAGSSTMNKPMFGPFLPTRATMPIEPAMHGVRDPELVGGTLGEQPIAAVRVLLDVRLNLLGVHAHAHLGKAERHRPAFGHERQKRALLLLVAVGQQRAGADRELPRDLDGERPQPVRGKRLFDGRELAVGGGRPAELGASPCSRRPSRRLLSCATRRTNGRWP